MIRLSFFALLSFWSTHLFSQGYAVFSADTTRIMVYDQSGYKGLNSYATASKWFVNGQEMGYGMADISVKADPSKLDTILFQANDQAKFDTIICNIKEPKHFEFVFNSCCGGFYMKEKGQSAFFRGRVIFNLEAKNGAAFLGQIGEVGLKLNQGQSDTLKVACRSAMSPNVYEIVISEIEKCIQSRGEQSNVCLQIDDEISYDNPYCIVADKVSFLYLPLSKDPLILTYDPKSNVYILR